MVVNVAAPVVIKVQANNVSTQTHGNLRAVPFGF